MLRVTIELVPFGEEDRKKKIGEMVIANTGGNHEGGFSYQGWTSADGFSKTPIRFGKVENHDRNQNVWELISCMIVQCLFCNHKPDRKKDSISQRLKRRLSK